MNSVMEGIMVDTTCARRGRGSWTVTLVILVTLWYTNQRVAYMSDHLDSPTVIADPSADIGDIYGWMSADGRRVNLLMDIVGARFSDKLQYVFHVDSGARFGATTASTSIVCQFDAAGIADCWAGKADHVRGDVSAPAGLEGEHHRFRVFAGLRDDPFFNNVKGTRSALNLAGSKLDHAIDFGLDDAGCPGFDRATSSEILDRWKHTDGGPATDFLAGWKTNALVVSIDRSLVSSGGSLLAVWGAVVKSGEQIERVGRPLTKNALIGPLAPGAESDKRKEEYNRTAPENWQQFAPDLARTLALYDGFDGTCGNTWLARKADGKQRYQRLAKVLADDRLWINSAARVCNQFMAVELSALGTPGAAGAAAAKNDCGGRTLDSDAVDVLRSLWANGTTRGVDDGVDRDSQTNSRTEFPFLAAPATTATATNASANTNGSTSIAIDNLDFQIAQPRDASSEADLTDLLLMRARFLGDYEALDRAGALTESRSATAADLLRRARVRSAMHRFAEALQDLDAAERSGASRDQSSGVRASILVATGHAQEAIPQLERELQRKPGYGSRSALAVAYAATGRYDEADRLYAAALADLDTTSPFPYAWIYFARGLMWTEQAGDAVRGEAMYARALTYLPQFAQANVHLAEIEARRGDLAPAITRLERVVTATQEPEPEALSLLGELHVRTGETDRGECEILLARQRYDALLARHPLAFADHAAEFYLGPGADVRRAWDLALTNLANRQTDRAYLLAIKAAFATGLL
jgi:tetratricopeptide (TPR) repeat protein